MRLDDHRFNFALTVKCVKYLLFRNFDIHLKEINIIQASIEISRPA
jgi:hypothetical protein